MNITNIFNALPKELEKEVFEDIVNAETVRIERIISKGHSSPDNGWYDQEENEWVIVIQGMASLKFDDGSIYDLSVGDYINIPAHVKHQVFWTDPNEITVWLAVFY